jgi:hypothetical protein
MIMKVHWMGLLITALFLAGGCAKKAAGPDVEVIDGVEYVHNTGSPLQPKLTVDFREELSFGGDEEPKEATLYRPRGILVDENDCIYVSDYQDAMIKVFDRQGKFVRAIGRKGQGPGEFQAMTAMDFLPDGRLLVFDIQSRRTSLFDRTGRFINGHSWRNSHFEILLTDESGYLADENVYGEERKLFVKKYDFEGNELENWGEFTPMGWKTQTKGEMTISITTPYTPQSIFAGDPARKRLYHCRSDTYTIEAYDGPGRLVRKFSRPYEPLPFTRKDAEDYYAGFDRRNNKVISEMAREVELPKVKTVADDIFVDDRGNLWVVTNELDASKEPPFRAYDIFSPDGYYTSRLWLNFRPGVFVRGKMYRLDSDEETGFIRLKRYSVTWSE